MRTAQLVRIRPATVALLVVILVLPKSLFAEDLSAKKVLTAIKRGQNFLLNEQQPNGSWSIRSGDLYRTGCTSLVLLALLNSGKTLEDKGVQNGLTYLRGLPLDEPKMTYEVSLMISVFATASVLAPAKDRQRDKGRLITLTQRLESMQITDGQDAGLWTYGAASGIRRGDCSNGQFAILGLRDAAHVGIPVSTETWQRANDYWTGHQKSGGGWGYTGSAPPTGSMTVAGISSLVICDSMLRDEQDLDPDGNPLCCRDEAHNEAVERGVGWMTRNFSVGKNPRGGLWLLYYLYGLERAGRLSGTRFFGDHDWYREGAKFLLDRQSFGKGKEGAWADNRHSGQASVLGTSFALLFLSKGLSPVLINKLKYGTPDAGKKNHVKESNWNKHPNDVRNLTDLITTRPKWPKLVTWQVVDFNKLTAVGDVGELQQAPILYLSGRDAPAINDPRQIELLKDYVNQGGFIFAVANCSGAGFHDGFQKLIEQMFPGGEAKLKRLGADHPVFRSEYPLDAETVDLYGVDFGCRTAIIYSPYDLSCLWDKWSRQDPLKRSPKARLMITKATRIGVNVVAYATGRELLNKLDETEERDASGAQDKIERGLLQVAKLRHPGEWNAAPQTFRNLLLALNQTAGLSASTRQRNLAASDPNLFRYPVAFMHGKKRFQLSRQETDQLRKYLDRGGFLFADSVCGARQFDISFRDLMRQVFPDKKLTRIPVDHEMFGTKVGHDVRRVKRRMLDVDNPNEAIEAAVREGEPLFEGIEIDGRYAVVYSKYDISCALQRQASVACAGYVEADATKLAVNVLLYAMLQDVGFADTGK